MLQHFYRLGIAKRLAPQSSEVMSQAGVFSFDSNHISFADNVIRIGNKQWIDAIAITDIEVTVPQHDELP